MSTLLHNNSINKFNANNTENSCNTINRTTLQVDWKNIIVFTTKKSKSKREYA